MFLGRLVPSPNLLGSAPGVPSHVDAARHLPALEGLIALALALLAPDAALSQEMTSGRHAAADARSNLSVPFTDADDEMLAAHLAHAEAPVSGAASRDSDGAAGNDLPGPLLADAKVVPPRLDPSNADVREMPPPTERHPGGAHAPTSRRRDPGGRGEASDGGEAATVQEDLMLSQDLADEALADVVAVGRERGFHCTGVLVAPAAVLTARHCLPATRVAFGRSASAPVLVIAVSGARTPRSSVDAALLLLERPAPVPPRARRGGRETDRPAGLMRLAGFGAANPAGDAGAGIKRRVDVPVVGWGCNGDRVRTLGCEPDTEMLIPRGGDRDTCAGDSGGPVLERHGRSWRLVAITSRPIPSAQPCGRGGIYERVDRIDAWIQQVVTANEVRGSARTLATNAATASAASANRPGGRK